MCYKIKYTSKTNIEIKWVIITYIKNDYVSIIINI